MLYLNLITQLVIMFKGSITAMVTPFKDGELDISSFEKFIEFQISNGTSGLVPCGTTGESPTLDFSEHKKIIDITVSISKGRVPVIAGTGSNSTKEAIELTRYAEKAKVDAALVVTPYYNKPTQEGLYQHYKAINDSCGIPIIIYNIPGRCVIDMSVETMSRLFELKNIIGVKDATGDLNRVDEQLKAMGKDFLMLTGNDENAYEFNKRGGSGCISVSSNVCPQPTNPIRPHRGEALPQAHHRDFFKKAAFWAHFNGLGYDLNRNFIFCSMGPSHVYCRAAPCSGAILYVGNYADSCSNWR